jgi:capsular polysaccharide transport system permease protein
LISAPYHIQPPRTFGRIITLLERERKTRFAGGMMGYLWAYITPVVWIGFVAVLFWLLDRSPPIFVSAEIFVTTGILPYIFFRQTVSSLGRSIPAQRYLRYLQPISNNDILTATMLLEGYNVIITSLLILGGLTILFGIPGPTSLTNLIFSLSIAWGLGCGVGRFVAAVGLMSDSFARSVPLLLRPLFWLSGIFYTATELPAEVRDILWYSPLLHVTELTREAYFLGYTSPIADAWYPLAVMATFFLISIPIETFATRRRLMRHRL